MSTIRDATVWIGQTKKELRCRVYVTGKRPGGDTTVWILGSGEAKIGGLPGFPAQGPGFTSQADAEAFARATFPTQSRIDEFVANDLNPLSLKISSAPVLIQKVEVN